jgi:hypothetical protein
MTEKTAMPPPLPAANPIPKRNWGWLKITVGIIAAGLLAIGILGSYNSLDLELVRRDLFDAAHDGRVLEVTNTGKKPLRVTGIKINDRSDCSITRLSFVDGSPLVPSIMKIGDQISLVSSCQIIRVSVETDQGSNTYSFNRHL